MTSTMTVRALLFDFDGTIVESERINDELFAEFLRTEYAILLSPEAERMNYGRPWSTIFAHLEREYGVSNEQRRTELKFLQLKAEYLRGTRLRTARGLESLLALPLPRAIVSGSTNGEIDTVMDNIGLGRDRFDLIIGAEDCERGKPDPDGFLRALDILGVPAGETIVFEDSPAGIQAARAAGIPVAFVAEFALQDNRGMADICFSSLEDACPWVRKRMEPGNGASREVCR